MLSQVDLLEEIQVGMKSEVFELLSSEVVMASSLIAVVGCPKVHQSCRISFLIASCGAKFLYCLEEQGAVVHALIITKFTNTGGFFSKFNLKSSW